MKKGSEKIKVGISIGDPNGIGMEIIIKTLLDNRMMDFCTPIVYGSSKTASYHRKALNIGDFSFNIIKSADEANPKLPNLINVWTEEINIELGVPSETAGIYALKSLEAATNDIASNKIDVLVTAPVNKDNMRKAGFKFPGQTEYLADYANEENPLMMMINDSLKVALATVHIPLKEVAGSITQDLLSKKLDVLHHSLITDFGVRKPKIAVLGLNPHAGDNGLLGDEEERIITPAINQAREKNILAMGPYAADGLFGSPSLNKFDGLLAMYHDQGLAPFKALAFDDGVNYSAGLPIVRTSPDHGVGYDIAGKGIASENSFRNAIYRACDIYKSRKEYRKLSANTLKTTQELKRED